MAVRCQVVVSPCLAALAAVVLKVYVTGPEKVPLRSPVKPGLTRALAVRTVAAPSPSPAVKDTR